MLIYVLDDGETWTLAEPTPVAVTDEQLDRIEGGEKVYRVVPDWADRPDPLCNCVKCTTARTASRNIVAAQNEAAPTDVLVEALDHLATCGSETNDYALCVHCGASHHMDDDHTCVDPDDDGECEECGGMGHTIGFEGSKQVKYPCESCSGEE